MAKFLQILLKEIEKESRISAEQNTNGIGRSQVLSCEKWHRSTAMIGSYFLSARVLFEAKVLLVRFLGMISRNLRSIDGELIDSYGVGMRVRKRTERIPVSI